MVTKPEKIIIRCSKELYKKFYKAKYENEYETNAEFLRDLLTTERKFVVAEEEKDE